MERILHIRYTQSKLLHRKYFTKVCTTERSEIRIFTSKQQNPFICLLELDLFSAISSDEVGSFRKTSCNECFIQNCYL